MTESTGKFRCLGRFVLLENKQAEILGKLHLYCLGIWCVVRYVILYCISFDQLVKSEQKLSHTSRKFVSAMIK